MPLQLSPQVAALGSDPRDPLTMLQKRQLGAEARGALQNAADTITFHCSHIEKQARFEPVRTDPTGLWAPQQNDPQIMVI